MPAPTLANPAAMATTTVGSALTVARHDGSTQRYALAYHPFFVTGDQVPDGHGGTVLAGGYYDIQHRPIIDRSKPGAERPFFPIARMDRRCSPCPMPRSRASKATRCLR